jgi:hypothetical protein
MISKTKTAPLYKGKEFKTSTSNERVEIKGTLSVSFIPGSFSK